MVLGLPAVTSPELQRGSQDLLTTFTQLLYDTLSLDTASVFIGLLARLCLSIVNCLLQASLPTRYGCQRNEFDYETLCHSHCPSASALL
jgi:hypothetical protein